MRDWVPLVVGVLGLLGALYAARVARSATAVNAEANQIKWLQEAKGEAAQARADAVQLRRDFEQMSETAANTRRDLSQTRREVIEQRDLIEELTRWTLRVVDWAHDPETTWPELRRLINGGPPSMRSAYRPNGERAADREGS